MAAKKKKQAKKKRPRVIIRRRWMARTPEERRWRMFNHDVDTLLHELVKNPELARDEPAALVARAVAFAEAYRAMQDERRPAGVSPEFDA